MEEAQEIEQESRPEPEEDVATSLDSAVVAPTSLREDLATEAAPTHPASAPVVEPAAPPTAPETVGGGAAEEPAPAKRKREDADPNKPAEEASPKRLRTRSLSKEIESQSKTPPPPEDEGDMEATTAEPSSKEITSTSDGSGEANSTKEDVKEEEGKEEEVVVLPERKKENPLLKRRMRAQQLTEEYVELSSRMMLMPTTHLGPYGYETNNPHQDHGETDERKNYPLELISSLGYLKSPLRRPTIIEKWSPYEISLFEAGMGHYGKEFYQIHKLIGTKSTKEVIDFYYIWKKTSHYKVWKEQYVAPGDIVSDDEYATTPVKKTVR